jgi:hypothetical protein
MKKKYSTSRGLFIIAPPSFPIVAGFIPLILYWFVAGSLVGGSFLIPDVTKTYSSF